MLLNAFMAILLQYGGYCLRHKILLRYFCLRSLDITELIVCDSPLIRFIITFSHSFTKANEQAPSSGFIPPTVVGSDPSNLLEDVAS